MIHSTDDEVLRRDRFVREAIVFMQAIINEYGEEKGEEMWDTIVTTLDPSVKRQILMMMLTGTYTTKVVIRGFVGEPRKVNAIKAVRQVTGLGLKEAKEIIDKAFGNFIRDKNYRPGEITKGTPVEIDVDPNERLDAIKALESVGCLL